MHGIAHIGQMRDYPLKQVLKQAKSQIANMLVDFLHKFSMTVYMWQCQYRELCKGRRATGEAWFHACLGNGAIVIQDGNFCLMINN